MKKEKFLFELIDNYLYMVNLGCMVMENYLLEDKTEDYTICADVLDSCLDFYDQLYSHIDTNEYSSGEVDAILGTIIQTLRQRTIKNILTELEKNIQEFVPDPKRFIEENLVHDKEGRVKDLTASAFMTFFEKLRDAEEDYAASRKKGGLA